MKYQDFMISDGWTESKFTSGQAIRTLHTLTELPDIHLLKTS